LVPEGGCFNKDNQKRGRPIKPEATSSETGNEEKFLLEQNRGVEAWNMVPGDIKRAKTVSSFKNAYRNHSETMVENAQDG
jgi:hypothetical protein